MLLIKNVPQQRRANNNGLRWRKGIGRTRIKTCSLPWKTNEITEFCPSGLTQSSSTAHARNGCSQSSRFLPQARRIVGSGDENDASPRPPQKSVIIRMSDPSFSETKYPCSASGAAKHFVCFPLIKPPRETTKYNVTATMCPSVTRPSKKIVPVPSRSFTVQPPHPLPEVRCSTPNYIKTVTRA